MRSAQRPVRVSRPAVIGTGAALIVAAAFIVSAWWAPGRSEAYLFGIVLVVAVAGAVARWSWHLGRRRAAGVLAAVACSGGLLVWIVPGLRLPDAPARPRAEAVAADVSAVVPRPDGFFLLQRPGTVEWLDPRGHSGRTQALSDSDTIVPAHDGPRVYRVDGSSLLTAFGTDLRSSEWTREVDIDQTTSQLYLVATPRDGGIVVAVVTAGAVDELLAFDADGQPRWTQDLRGRSFELKWLFARQLTRPNAPIVLATASAVGVPPVTYVVDPASGDLRPLPGASSVVLGDRVVVLDGDCQVSVFDDLGELQRTIDGGCDAADAYLTAGDHGVIGHGSIVRIVEEDTWTLVDVEGAAPPRPVERRTRDVWTPQLDVRRGEHGDTITLAATDVTLDDDGWSFGTHADGTLARYAEPTSRNPRRATDRRPTRIEIVDIATGTVCARVEVPSRYAELTVLPLPDCRAVIVDPAWRDGLVIGWTD